MKTFPPKWFDPGPKVYWRGRWFDRAMTIAITDAERELEAAKRPAPIYIFQGSYNAGVKQSAGTHDKGACLDKQSRGLEERKAFARQGVVFLPRTPEQGFSYHDHGWMHGADTAAPALKAQMIDWGVNDRNGLARRGADDSGVRDVFRSYPEARKAATVVAPNFYLDGANKSLKFGSKVRPYASVKLMQTALNRIPGGKTLAVDGVAGPLTSKEFNAWRASRFEGVTHGPVGARSAKLLFKDADMKINVRAVKGGKAL